MVYTTTYHASNRLALPTVEMELSSFYKIVVLFANVEATFLHVMIDYFYRKKNFDVIFIIDFN